MWHILQRTPQNLEFLVSVMRAVLTTHRALISAQLQLRNVSHISLINCFVWGASEEALSVTAGRLFGICTLFVLLLILLSGQLLNPCSTLLFFFFLLFYILYIVFVCLFYQQQTEQAFWYFCWHATFLWHLTL